MKRKIFRGVALAVALFAILFNHLRGVAQDANMPGSNPTNQLPNVTIVFPPSYVRMSWGTTIFIRARASEADAQIAAVRFYADTELIGAVTNEPYNLSWFLVPTNAVFFHGSAVLTAVAVDNLGATNTSKPVVVYSLQGPVGTDFIIRSPANPFGELGSLAFLPATVDFTFSAQMDNSNGLGNTADFFVGTNRVGSTADSPYSVTVTNNFADGNYSIVVATWNGPNDTGQFGPASQSRQISIVPLLIQEPQQSAGGGFSFRAAGRVAGKATVIEASTNLLTWQPIATNLTSTNSFLFADPQATNFSRRFYRASFKE